MQRHACRDLSRLRHSPTSAGPLLPRESYALGTLGLHSKSGSHCRPRLASRYTEVYLSCYPQGCHASTSGPRLAAAQMPPITDYGDYGNVEGEQEAMCRDLYNLPCDGGIALCSHHHSRFASIDNFFTGLSSTSQHTLPRPLSKNSNMNYHAVLILAATASAAAINEPRSERDSVHVVRQEGSADSLSEAQKSCTEEDGEYCTVILRPSQLQGVVSKPITDPCCRRRVGVVRYRLPPRRDG